MCHRLYPKLEMQEEAGRRGPACFNNSCRQERQTKEGKIKREFILISAKWEKMGDVRMYGEESFILDSRVGEISRRGGAMAGGGGGGGEQGTEAGGGGRGWHRDQSCMEKRYEIIQENSIRGSYLHPGLCPHPPPPTPVSLFQS